MLLSASVAVDIDVDVEVDLADEVVAVVCYPCCWSWPTLIQAWVHVPLWMSPQNACSNIGSDHFLCIYIYIYINEYIYIYIYVSLLRYQLVCWGGLSSSMNCYILIVTPKP